MGDVNFSFGYSTPVAVNGSTYMTMVCRVRPSPTSGVNMLKFWRAGPMVHCRKSKSTVVSCVPGTWAVSNRFSYLNEAVDDR